jgi:squalene monooxygenase
MQVRCLVDVPGEKLPGDLPGYLRQVVAPELPQELQPAFLEAVDTGNIRSMQNKQLSCRPLHQPGRASKGEEIGAMALEHKVSAS